MQTLKQTQLDPSERNGMHQAVQAAGGQVLLSHALGVSQQAVSVWLRQGWAPIKRARQIERVLGISAAKVAHPDFLIEHEVPVFA